MFVFVGTEIKADEDRKDSSPDRGSPATPSISQSKVASETAHVTSSDKTSSARADGPEDTAETVAVDDHSMTSEGAETMTPGDAENMTSCDAESVMSVDAAETVAPEGSETLPALNRATATPVESENLTSKDVEPMTSCDSDSKMQRGVSADAGKQVGDVAKAITSSNESVTLDKVAAAGVNAESATQVQSETSIKQCSEAETLRATNTREAATGTTTTTATTTTATRVADRATTTSVAAAAGTVDVSGDGQQAAPTVGAGQQVTPNTAGDCSDQSQGDDATQTQEDLRYANESSGRVDAVSQPSKQGDAVDAAYAEADATDPEQRDLDEPMQQAMQGQ